MRRNAAAFSASRSSAVTRKPSSGGGGSLSGSPCLRGSRGNLRLPGLGLSDVGAPFSQEPGAHLSVVGGTGVTCCWRPPHTVTVPTADAEPRRLVEMRAPSTAFL
ncbi:hypothetical protein MG293_013738 [Ovis ammon polii]|uniref:Uncharacterized protein n=2 Tax=Ovis TaxID=9935 RepID=A0A835ZRT4_SHEEP|nr:hypothetical protein JEQ12_007412 [Ovis aries]KAI4536346.1 hypothetical protein MG293_013738 [Ovis ammon polii]